MRQSSKRFYFNSVQRHSILWWLGSRAFVANSTASGVATAYFALVGNLPMVALILLLWFLSMVTWNEYRAIINN